MASNLVAGSDHADTTAVGSTGPTLVEQLRRLSAEQPDAPAFTFVDYTTDRDGVPVTATFAETDRRARAVAAWLLSLASPGDRAAILAPQGLDYIVGFLGCLYAGVVAVPLFPPSLPGHGDRLVSVLADCDPACILTVDVEIGEVDKFLAAHPDALPPHRSPTAPDSVPPELVALDRVPVELATAFQPEPSDPEGIAYLQYTSGSTRTPAGVMISHRNIAANAQQTLAAFLPGDGSLDGDDGEPACAVSWLPLFHDMGLVLATAAPIMARRHSVVIDPVAFLMRPVRWLRLMSEYPGAISAAPNFAFDFCSTRITEADRQGLDLSRVRAILNGAEPIRGRTLARFQEVFGPHGLPPHAQHPAYGLAEATVFVTAGRAGQEPVVTRFDRARLTEGEAVPATGDDRSVSELVSCGGPIGQRIAIVDPVTGAELPPGRVGEVWVHGPNVGHGYWQAPERTAETFGAELTSALDPATPRGPWMRTGDLGTVHDGGLHITGRIKDLIIVDGRNHYPQEIEDTVQSAHPVIRRDHVAAFSVPTEGGEGVVIVAEYAPRAVSSAAELDTADIRRTATAAVSAQHSLPVHDFVVVAPGSIPRTSSGKVARTACCRSYLDGALARVGSTA